MQETLEVTDGAPGLQALLSRAVGLDATASARLRQLDEFVEVFVTTPFEVVASRRAKGTVGRDGAVVGAHELLSALRNGESQIGPPRDPNWPGALPPAAGFTLVDNVPVQVVRQLADQGQALTRQFSGPLGPPASLLNQTVLTVTGGGHEAAIPMRMIFTCTSLSLIPGFAAPMDVPRHLRVSVNGRWVRVDAPFGSVFRSTGLSLF
ncbi:hypothetical protein [Corynebacterium halotolerans]|uniref:hypothetical protein n=1 Tax=Corynebacterium halotolerans TaxID=225326 RepID=UPI003CFA2F03